MQGDSQAIPTINTQPPTQWTREQWLQWRNALLILVRLADAHLWPENERTGRKRAELKKNLASEITLP